MCCRRVAIYRIAASSLFLCKKNEEKEKEEEQAARINVLIGIKTTHHYVLHTY